MNWDNDLTGPPEDTVVTEPPKEQPLPLTPEEPAGESEDLISQPHSVTDDIEYSDDPIAHPEESTYVDADAEVTEPEERSLDPYDILRDDPFAVIPRKSSVSRTDWDSAEAKSSAFSVSAWM